jgi:tetratricopeptide (TPR) repeat protein
MYQNNFEFYESSESQILSILKNLETQGKQKTHLYHICYSNLANCFRLKKEYHKAIEITNKAISMAKENDLTRLVYEFNCQLGSIYLEIKDEEKMQLIRMAESTLETELEDEIRDLKQLDIQETEFQNKMNQAKSKLTGNNE